MALTPGTLLGPYEVLDFGLAKSVSSVIAQETASPTLAQALTGQGTILGTLQDMAPEQLEGRDVDARADIFTFGSVLYEMLTGKRAFDGKSQASVIASIPSGDPPAVSSQQPVTPTVLDHLIGRALAKDPVDRWTSMHDVLLQFVCVRRVGPAPGVRSGLPGPCRQMADLHQWRRRPAVRADGGELFFIGADHKLMAVAITQGKTFDPGIPTPLFQTRVTGLTDVRTHYQVSADPQRFLVNTIGPADRGSPIQVVGNLQTALGK